MTPLRLAVVGTGHMGQLHARVAASLPGATLVAVVDTDRARAEGVAKNHGVPALADHRALCAGATRPDAVIVAVPTIAHVAVACDLLAAGLPVLVEKPLAATAVEAERIVAAAARSGALLSVGHVERWNPAFRAALPSLAAPIFIESHRLAPFAFRSADVGVVMDLLIHDLDLVLTLVDQEPTQVDAAGVAILTPREDIVNVRLGFPSGCVANLTASRASEKVMRRLRVFAADRYVSVDLGERKVEVVRRSPKLASGQLKPETMDPRAVKDRREVLRTELLEVIQVPVPAEEPLAGEQAAFVAAVRAGGPAPVSGAQALRVLRLAERVLASVADHQRAVGLR